MSIFLWQSVSRSRPIMRRVFFTALSQQFPLCRLHRDTVWVRCRRLSHQPFLSEHARLAGIPQAIAARELESSAAREKLVRLFRTGIGKIFISFFLGLLIGASIGREGPTVQVGASIMFAIGRLSPSRQPGLILAGAAAGVAAAFNTPIAGIVFAIEEISRSFEMRTSGLVCRRHNSRRLHVLCARRQLHLFRIDRRHGLQFRRRLAGRPALAESRRWGAVRWALPREC